jgi:EpsI family protein
MTAAHLRLKAGDRMNDKMQPRVNITGRILSVLLLGAGLVAVYAQSLIEMWHRWFPAWDREHLSLYDRLVEGASYYTHGPLIPLVSLIVAGVIIHKARIPVRPAPLMGWAVLGLSVLAHLASAFARVSFVSLFSILGVLAGLVLIFWGRQALQKLWFPIVFLFFMVPLPEVSIAQLNFRLKMLASQWGVQLSNLVGIVAERTGNMVFLQGDKQLVIANVCNGLRTLISLLAFGALYAYVCRLRGSWRLVLFSLSIPVAAASNVVRIVSLIVVADIWNTKVATQWFHDFSGLLIYVIAFALMFGLERVILFAIGCFGGRTDTRELFSGQRREEGDAQWGRLAGVLVSPRAWAAIIVLVLVGGATMWLNRAQPSVWDAQVAQNLLPEDIEWRGRQLHGFPMELDDRTLMILETRDYVYRRYAGQGLPTLDACVVFSEDNRKGTHPPDLCLEGGGQEIVWKQTVKVVRGAGTEHVNCRELIVQRGPYSVYFLYTYRCGDSYTSSFWGQQATILLNGLLNRDASGALIRVSTPLEPDRDAARARAKQLMNTVLNQMDKNLKS